MNDIDKIKDASDFMFNSQGYRDSEAISKMTGIPKIVVDNVFNNLGYKKVSENQYI